MAKEKVIVGYVLKVEGMKATMPQDENVVLKMYNMIVRNDPHAQVEMIAVIE